MLVRIALGKMLITLAILRGVRENSHPKYGRPSDLYFAIIETLVRPFSNARKFFNRI